MTTPTNDSALAFVGQIITAYNAAEKAGASALGYALECGKYLNLAKENVEAATPKRKWKTWREANLKVSEETERLYRRLADAVARKEDIFAKCKSIRDAIKHLSRLDENLNPKPAPAPKPKASRTGSTAAALEPPDADTSSGGLEAELENAAADEIIGSIQGDADKLEEVAQRSIAKLPTDKVYDALTKALLGDELRDLTSRLNAYVGKLPPPTQMLSPGEMFKRRSIGVGATTN